MDNTAITRGNAVFRAAGVHQGLAMMPRRRMMIIGCADPRVDPEKVLGLRMGDAAVIRNIGGRVTAPTLATIAGLGRLGALAAQASAQPSASARPELDLLVLHHTDCGILRLAEEPEALAGFLGTDLAHVNDMHIRDPRAAVAHDVAVLRSLDLPGQRTWGLVYDVATGAIELTVTPKETIS